MLIVHRAWRGIGWWQNMAVTPPGNSVVGQRHCVLYYIVVR
jgi:hypothetical protein